MKKVLIVGAGEAGQMVAREIRKKKNIAAKYRLAGFLDDSQRRKSVSGLPVLGTISDAPAVIRDRGIQEVIIAIPSAAEDVIRRIVSVLSRCEVPVRIVPGIYEIIEGRVRFDQIRLIRPEDLLGREEVGFDAAQIRPYYRGRTVMVTGAGGSIGSEIVLHLLKLPVRRVVAFGHGENSIHALKTAAGRDARFTFCIGDVRDAGKLRQVIARYRPQIVFHAAAHKHVPLMEAHPDEAVKTNVLGTELTLKACVDGGVKRFVLVSTDKAVRPASVMGATKRIAERITLSYNRIQKKTFCSLTRFGNVLGSRGSVIPTFRQQIEQGGPLTVTHRDMTRYFMSIPEAARLVIKSATLLNGEVFELDMGKPVRILDLAKNLLRLYGYGEQDVPIVFTGLRPGEKMHEELAYPCESLVPTVFPKLLVSRESAPAMSRNEIGKMVRDLETAACSGRPAAVRKTLALYLGTERGGGL